MTDGTQLATDIYFPEGEGPWPVVLGRTPYGKSNLTSGSIMLPATGVITMNEKGIAVAIQDVRGRNESEGEPIAFVADGWGEHKDGLDTVQWLREQTWCNGNIATIGASAGGVTQILLDGTNPPGIAGQWIGLAPISSYHYFAYTGGVFRTEMVNGWLATAQWPIQENLSLIRSHPYYDDHWREQNLADENRVGYVDWPVVIGAAWYDLFLQGSLDLYEEIRNNGAPGGSENVHLLIGPYTHTTFGKLEHGEVTFPESAYIPYKTVWPEESSFINNWLFGEPLEPEAPRVLYYVMGDVTDPDAPGNEWRAAGDWPPAAERTRLYLSAGESLSETAPSTETTLQYSYDPRDPVPTRGGQNFMLTPSGPYDQTGNSGNEDIESRDDVLIFTTGVFTEPVEVTGRLNAVLYVSTSAADTDFTAKITDVYPDGRSMLVMDSIRKLSLREDYSQPQAVVAGQKYRLEIDLGSTSLIFNTGHRLRLAVSSSNSPRFEENSNTGDPESQRQIIAQQSVYMGGEVASYLEIPIVTIQPTPTPTATPTSIETPTATPTSTPIVPESSAVIPDFDNSGTVDALDLTMLIDGMRSGQDGFDLNGDGSVNAFDIMNFNEWWRRDVVMPLPYYQGEWSTIHRDHHNSDYIPRTIGSISDESPMREIAWLFDDPANPIVSMPQLVFGDVDGIPAVFVTTGKLTHPNIYAFRISDGSELWHSAPPSMTNEYEAGPDSCLTTSSPAIDTEGNLYLSDCHYIYCYGAHEGNDENGNRRFTWKRPMPNLKVYNPITGFWSPSDDPTEGDTFAAPFLSYIFTPPINGKSYFGGISINGEVCLFDKETGELFAETTLQSPAPPAAQRGDPPCDPYDYAERDVPMEYDPEGENADNLIPFGVWTTGTNTDDPDLDYFMNPCQLAAYIAGNTLGGGSMVANTPAVNRAPDGSQTCHIFVTGTQSTALKRFDDDPLIDDCIMYRIDFDPSAAPEDRLQAANHRYINGVPAFDGRMPNGKNSATSPVLTVNDRWVYGADNEGFLYGFRADNGELIWSLEIGATLGSPTLMQEASSDGYHYIYAFGADRVWAIAIDPETGGIPVDDTTGEPMRRVLDYRPYILENVWRQDDPGYSETYLNAEGNAFVKHALGASIVVGSRDKLFTVYTVGWRNPDDPTGSIVIPTHSAILIVDRNRLMTDDEADTVEAAFIDTHDTCEIGFKFHAESEPPIGIMSYGSQSSSMAQYIDANGGLPEGMRDLYVKPKGGIRILEFQR